MGLGTSLGITALSGAGGAGGTLLLDLFGTDILVAYSFRKLSSTYSGNAVRVRRTSDNAEQDIGFDGNGDLDTSALTTFLGSDDGFITKWYDQAGNNRDGAQTNANRQIKIATGGTIETANSLPTTQGNNNDALIISGIPLTSQPITTFDVYAHNTATGAGNSQTFKGQTSTSTNFIQTRIQRRVRFGAITNDGTGQVQSFSTTQHQDTDLHVVTRMFNGASSVIRIDQTGETYNNNPNGGAQIGGANLDRIGETSTNSYNGKLSEILVYGADKTSDFTNIEDNLKTYYSTP